MADRHDELRLHFQHLRRPLIGPEGQALLEYLEQRYCERRTVQTERLPDGTAYQMLTRLSSFVPGDPHETARNEGRREVVLFLKDLVDLES